MENLLLAWQEFVRDKKKKRDIQEFQLNLIDNVYSLNEALQTQTYTHGKYFPFKINDPKPRDIHKALVRDRLLHHAIYRILYPFFDKKFIHDSYSCRIDKGTHKAIDRFRDFSRIVSKNNTKTCWVLKCDIRKFFASIDHKILKDILQKSIKDKDTLSVLDGIIDSFNSILVVGLLSKGLPLGNLTSQLLVNIYMNEFDQFVKHKLKVKYYIRYADDFVTLSQDKIYLENILIKMQEFLIEKLKLDMHPNKVFIKTLASGVDFLGWVHFPKHRVLRESTKRRMWRNLNRNGYKKESLNSYLGMIKHGDGYGLKSAIMATYDSQGG